MTDIGPKLKVTTGINIQTQTATLGEMGGGHLVGVREELAL